MTLSHRSLRLPSASERKPCEFSPAKAGWGSCAMRVSSLACTLLQMVCYWGEKTFETADTV